MKPVLAATAGAAALAALLVGCSSSSGSSTGSGSASASSSASAPAGGAATLKTAGSPEGKILVDGAGRTLYVFESDTSSTSTCNGACAAAWPPVVTSGTPNSSGLTASLVGTSVRTDHTTQVTYKGHPLYTFTDDSKAGEINGQGVTAFGGKWYVISPSGDAITTAATTPASTPSSTSGGGY
ncbi:COG4315 family predicted lipoprotein [Kitasatospora sp. NBC_01302]|uniref:COG4315 family predicted lipoprotein n=1 Tax=Kitasatospora sp. NBC_01302 TaxID=2903575 RepID=UPI002E0DD815|nr:hypothetical protein OG294_00590 [Kitasatospora sp. NBC_01302]